MPKGIPAAGFRKSRKTAKTMPVAIDLTTYETDAEIEAKLTERFDILKELTDSAIAGEARSLIVSGPPGLGKSFTVEAALKAWDSSASRYSIVKGYVKTTGLFRLLWKHRHAGNVIVFDDADSIFNDDTSLNMLKAVCDTTDERWVSYMADYDMVDEDSGELIDRTFLFNGTIIFISNIDFDAQVEKNGRLAPHMSAMISRSHYIDLEMKTKRDYIVRIKQVVRGGMLTARGLSQSASDDVVDFIEKNSNVLRELSLRMAIKIADLRKRGGNWERLARVTCCKTR